MTPKQILKLPYLYFLLSMLDAPSTDFESKEESKINKPETANDQMNAFKNFIN